MLHDTLSRVESRPLASATKAAVVAEDERAHPVARSDQSEEEEEEEEEEKKPPPGSGLGWLPLLSVSSGAGVALCTLGDALSRSTRSASQLPFWAGLLIIVVPIGLRLYSAAASRRERLCLVVLLGMALYLVKVTQNPFGFAYADEFVHAHNADAILRTHNLFSTNSLLPVTPKYPGLESVTAALSATSGLGIFGSGLIVIGAARVIIMLALFLLFERVSGSSQVAGVGTAIYTANSNFLFFGAQFSYESLALPLLVLVLAAVAERQASEGTLRRAWAVPIVVGTCAVVVTHHLSAYALVLVLVGLSFAATVKGSWTWSRGPWPFAVFALAVTVGWLTFVASSTVGYLTPVFTRAITSTVQTLSRESGARQLFATNSTGYEAPLLERAVGIVSVLILAAGMPFGMWRLWKRYRSNAFALVLATMAIAFFGVILLRFAPGAWETANRSSEFLFIGLAFVLALVPASRVMFRRMIWLGAGVMTALFAIVFSGGVIAGWQPLYRVSHPYRIKVGNQVIESESRMLARWAGAELGPGRRFAATQADARFLLLYAREEVLAGSNPNVSKILKTKRLLPPQLLILRENRLRYVAVDLRVKSTNSTEGYYFGIRPGLGVPDELFDRGVFTKFDNMRADRLYDSGTVFVYDLGPAFDAPTKR
jgi:hypothetical protein